MSVKRQNHFAVKLCIKIEDLTARDIQIAINVDAQRLGYKSIKNAVGFLRAVLNANDITIKMGSICLPKKEVRERRLPSADVIYAIVKGTSSELPVLLAMWLSLHIGEVAGLQFCDIDPVQMRLYVRREIVKVDSGWAEIDHCKTVKSMRYVNLPAYIYALIQQVPHQSGTDHIVPFTPNIIRKRFKKLLEAHGLEEIRFHDMRHIFASTTAMPFWDCILTIKFDWKRRHIGTSAKKNHADESLLYRVQILIVLYSNAPYIAIANKNSSQSCLIMGMAAAGEWLSFTVS